MKKRYISLMAFALLLGQAQTLEAKKITMGEALQNAYTFWGQQMPQRAKGGSISLTRASAAAEDAYYIFNATDGKGYVIVAGDDAVRPVLGYTTEGNFDAANMPDGLKELLASYKRQIDALPADAPAYTSTTATRSESMVESSKVIKTAKWNQDAPFNTYIPNGYPVGCVATAAAIIMKHFAYPTQGTGSNSYVWQGQKLSANFEHEYKWASMPMEYEKGVNEDQFIPVARLMSDIGIAVNMNYDKDGSGSSTYDVRNALVKNFGYSKLATFQYMDNYEDAEWKSKIRSNINNDQPVLYAAADMAQGGHAFVVDGYKGDLFSINWGWGGTYNGFFAIGQLAPEKDLKFNLQDNAIFNLKPADGTEVLSTLGINKNTDSFYGINMNTTDVVAGKPFNLYFANLANMSTDETFNGTFHIFITDSKGVRKEDLGQMDVNNLKPGYQYGLISANLEAKQTASEGDRIAFYSQATGSSDYIKLLGFDNTDISIPATGYTPRTAEIKTDLGDGVQLAVADNNDLYNGKIVLGSDFQFTVTTAPSITKSFVTINDVVTQLITPDKGDSYYCITETWQPSYTIGVKAYKDYAEKDLELAVAPKQLEEKLKDTDCFVYRNLKLTGSISSQDFKVLNKKPFRKIDLSECLVKSDEYYDVDNYIPESAFMYNESVEEFVMPKGIEQIAYNAFLGSALKSVVLPASISYFGGNCFWNCLSLNDVTMYHTTPPDISETVFFIDKAANRTLHVPEGTKEAYDSSAYKDWTQYFGNIVEDVQTGIKGVTFRASESNSKDQRYYDLNGRRIAAPSKGQTFIQGGKKYLMR